MLGNLGLQSPLYTVNPYSPLVLRFFPPVRKHAPEWLAVDETLAGIAAPLEKLEERLELRLVGAGLLSAKARYLDLKTYSRLFYLQVNPRDGHYAVVCPKGDYVLADYLTDRQMRKVGSQKAEEQQLSLFGEAELPTVA